MRHPHAVPAIHHHRCHRVLRDDDDERDEDERQDDEDREDDGRRDRVRAARAYGSHSRKRTRKHATCKHLSKAAQHPSKTRAQMAADRRQLERAVDLRRRGS